MVAYCRSEAKGWQSSEQPIIHDFKKDGRILPACSQEIPVIMRVREMLICSSLFCFSACTAVGQVQALRAEINLAQTVVKNNEDVPVTATIRNTGTAAETLVVWSCSYPAQWRPDKATIKNQGVDCMQNVPGRVRLKPGETNTRRVHVRAELRSPDRQSITFRLGYGTDGYFGTAASAPKSPAIWSNPVTVHIVSK